MKEEGNEKMIKNVKKLASKEELILNLKNNSERL